MFFGLGTVRKHLSISNKREGINGTKYSRMDQVKFVEDNL